VGMVSNRITFYLYFRAFYTNRVPDWLFFFRGWHCKSQEKAPVSPWCECRTRKDKFLARKWRGNLAKTSSVYERTGQGKSR
jgi:hypothetical protein